MTETRYGRIIVSGTARLCSIEGCGKRLRARGYCSAHWALWRRHGAPVATRTYVRNEAGPCAIEGCDRPSYRRGLCNAHSLRSQRGQPLDAPLQRPRQVGLPLEERFWRFVDRSESCWLWLGHKAPNGYGTFMVDARRTTMTARGAHRVAYELLRGPIPEGLQIDHLCRVRACVNPAHLEPVSAAENLRRARVAA